MLARLFARSAAAVVLGFAVASASVRGETLVIAGTGAAVSALDALGRAWSESDRGNRIHILRGFGNSGGMRALIDGRIDLAVVAREPNADLRREKGLRVIPFALSPFGFVTSQSSVSGLSPDFSRNVVHRGFESGKVVLRRTAWPISKEFPDADRVYLGFVRI
jgi:ABC-type phosphate transport system substrate-binding protein